MFEVFGLGAEFTFDSNGTERISDIVGDLQRLSSQMSLSTSQTREYANSLNEFAGVIGDMGKQLIVAGSAQTAAALYGVGKAAQWQTQMIDATRYMTDDSAAAQTEYNRQLKETAQLLGRTKEEINASVISYMMMGKSTDDALRLAKNAGYAAVTWDMTADSVADSFRTIKAAFNINLEDQAMYQRYLDTINEVGNSTAATSKDVIAFLAEGGAALHNVANVSIEQAMGMAAAARYANMPMGEFSTMMTRLGNQYAQDKSTKYFESLGISVKDASGEMRSFAEVLYDVQKRWNDLDQATKSEFASGVGGLYADRLSLYMGSGEEYIKGNQIANKDNTGSAEAEFQRVTNTFENAIARFKVTLSDFGQAFWGTLLPPLTKFINVVNKIVMAISNFMQAHPAIMKVVAGGILLIGVLTTLAGVILLVTSAMAKLKASQVLNHFAGLRLTNILRGMQITFRGMLPNMMNVVKGFGKIASSMGLIYVAWKYDLFNIRTTFEEFTSKLKLTMENVKTLMDNSITVKAFQDNVNKLNNSNSVFDKLALGITKVGMAFKGLSEYMKEGSISDDMFQKLNALGLMPFISIVIGLGMRLKAFWNGFKEGFTDVITTINNAIRKILGPAFTWLHDKILLPLAKAIFGVDEDVTSLKEAIGGIQFVDLDKMFGKIETWEKVGKVVGIVAGAFFVLSTATKGLGMLSMVGTALGGLGGVLGNLLHLGGGRNGGSGGGLFRNLFGGLFGGGSGGGNGGSGGGGGILGIPSPKTILKGMGDIALILGGFTILIEAYGLLSSIQGFDIFMSKGISTLKLMFSSVLEMAVGIGALAILTGLVSNIAPSNVIKGLADIALILGGFTLIFEAFGLLNEIPGFTTFLASGAATLTMLFDAMSVFGSPSFILMTVAIGIMGALSPVTFLSGIAGLAIMLGGVTLLIAAFAALTMIPGFTEFIETGAATLAMLFNAIGEIVGSLIGGFAEGITNSLPEIANNLSLFGQNLQPFFDAVSGAPVGEIGTFMSSFGAFMLMLAGEEILSFITGGPDLVGLGTDLSLFATNARGFFEEVATYPEAGLEKANLVFESISNLGGYATKSGGLAQLFTGTTDLPQLGSDLSDFATNARTFYTEVATYPEAGITKASKVFESVSNLGGYATKSGGVAQWFTGTTDLADLGENLSDFAIEAEGFFSWADGVSYGAITKAEKIFESLGAIGDYGFKSGGVAQWFTGSTDLTEIGEQLSDFAVAVEEFFDIVSSFSDGVVERGGKVFVVLSEMGDSAFRSGGFVEVFTGGVDLVNIGNQLTSFADSIEPFFSTMEGIDYTSISKAKSMFVALAEITEFANIALKLVNLGNVGTQLSNFITNAETFFIKVSSLDTSGVANLVVWTQPLDNFFAVFTVVDASTITGLASAMDTFGNSCIQLSTDLTALTTTAESDFDGMVESISQSMTDMSTNVTNGITECKTNIETNVSEIVSNVKAQFGGLSSSAYSYGANMTDAFARGIASNAAKVSNAANNVVKQAGDYIGFHSPTKKGEGQHIVEWGYNMVSGFAQGIQSAGGLLDKTMSDVITNPLAESATNMGVTVDGNGIGGYLSQIVGLLSMIASAKGSIIASQIDSSGYISTAPLMRAKETIQSTKEAITENNSRELMVNIESGAIQNEFHIDGDNTDKEELMEMFAEMLDSELLPLILEKFRELKVVLNE